MRRRAPFGLMALLLAAGLLAPGLTAAPAAAAEPTVVTSVDFDDGTTGSWTRSGGTDQTLSFIDVDGGQALRVSGRDADYVGVQSPTGLFQPGETYAFSLRARLAPDTTGSADIRFVMKPDYAWIGNTTMTADAWATVTGEYTVPADADPAGLQVYLGTSDLDGPYDYLVDDVLVTTAGGTDPGTDPGQEPGSALIETDFEDGELGGWAPRQGGSEPSPVVAVVGGGTGGTAYAAEVSGRTHEGDGIQHDVTGVLAPGATYRFDGAVRFAPGGAPGQGLTLSMRTVNGAQTGYANLIQFETVRTDGWTAVSGEFTVPAYDTAAELYVEARYNGGNTSTFLVDQLRVSVPEPSSVDTSLRPIKDAVPFPAGVAIDSRETTGSAADLLRHHFSQITPENHMKVEAWYDADHRFSRHAEATALLDFAQQNGLRMYGHVLLWHSQTPDWFFQDDAGRELTASDADKQLLRDRLARHIDDVARSVADDYGRYGSSTNPVVAWDVVNEVISDQQTSDGLRTSRWHDVLGEEYIPLAFRLADTAFNRTYAEPGTDRPVKLFINDYNTEQDVKGAQYHALVQRLVDADVPIDGVGHQFHVSLTTPVSALQGALARFAGMGLLQEVTELDVTMNPASEANRIRQGYYYRDMFALLRDYQAQAPSDEKLFAATIWGLTDNRSWRAEQEPLAFDAGFQAKPAYWGIVGDDSGLPPLVTTANVFGGDVALDEDAFEDAAWRNLPALPLTQEAGSFGLRWNEDHLTALVRTRADVDALSFTYGDAEFTYRTGDASSIPGIDAVRDGAHLFVVRLPHSGVDSGTAGGPSAGTTTAFDVRALVGDDAVGAWNSPGATGRLTLLEPLSTLDVPEASVAPRIDGVADDAWAGAPVIRTSRTVEGASDGATADVRTLWRGGSLFVLFEVTDPEVDLSNSDPWNRDSVELFLDLGNEKAGAYGPNATQIRVTADGDLSFGSGSDAAQRARVVGSATARTATGYTVELEVALIGQSGGQSDVPLGGLGTFHGLDAQVNDGRAGSRHAVHTWADPTGTGYQTTARWGVAQLVPAAATPTPTPTPTPTAPTTPAPTPTATPTTAPPADAWARVDVGSGVVEQGGALPVTVSGLRAGQEITATLYSDPIEVAGIRPADGAGRTAFSVSIPGDLTVGQHTLVLRSDDLADIRVGVTVVPPGQLAVTGAQLPWGIALGAALLVALGGLLLGLRRPRRGGGAARAR